MEFFTLDSAFRRVKVLDAYNTAIWTERYSGAGDFVFATEATRDKVLALAPGLLVSCSDSDEVGLIASRHTKDGILTAKGSFITKFLDERIVRSVRDHDQLSMDMTGAPGVIMGNLVAAMVVAGGSGTAGGTPPIPGGTYEVITNLTVGSTASGTSTTIAVQFGPLYTELKKIAEMYELGFKMYPDSVTPTSYSLKFITYAGRDLTRDNGGAYPVVEFTSALDSLTNVEELDSIEAFRNTCYAYSPNCLPTALGGTLADYGIARTGAVTTAVDFERRTMMVVCDDITADSVGSDLTKLKTALNQRAKDALANNNYVRMMDGQLVPQLAFEYGTDYLLGDIIELKGTSDVAQKARITEYIRTKDTSGERAYPTLSVIS